MKKCSGRQCEEILGGEMGSYAITNVSLTRPRSFKALEIKSGGKEAMLLVCSSAYHY